MRADRLLLLLMPSGRKLSLSSPHRFPSPSTMGCEKVHQFYAYALLVLCGCSVLAAGCWHPIISMTNKAEDDYDNGRPAAASSGVLQRKPFEMISTPK